jgi:2-oxopent-4-enoate/cis-2-oxohex-4-enoate hydratase
MNLTSIADDLWRAFETVSQIPPVSAQHAGLDLSSAYAISRDLFARRLARGERLIGRKIGVTSEAVQRALGVFEPDFGFLTDAMLCDGKLSRASMAQPRAEGELVFRMGRDLAGADATLVDVLASIDGVMACIEVVDSRIADWKITIVDTVADNASCGAIVLGTTWHSPDGVDFERCGVVFRKKRRGHLDRDGRRRARLADPQSPLARPSAGAVRRGAPCGGPRALWQPRAPRVGAGGRPLRRRDRRARHRCSGFCGVRDRWARQK